MENKPPAIVGDSKDPREMSLCGLVCKGQDPYDDILMKDQLPIKHTICSVTMIQTCLRFQRLLIDYGNHGTHNETR